MIGGANQLPDGRRTAKPRHLASRERSHEAVVGMRRLTERIVFDGILRRIMQKTQIGVGFVGEIRREVIGGKAERHGKRREHPVAHRAQRVEIGHHVGTQVAQPRRLLIATAQRLPGDHVGMVRSAIVGDKKALVLIGRVALCTAEAPCIEASIGR